MQVYYAAQCRTCNPEDAVLYDDPERRDYEAQVHADATGHWIEIGFLIK